MKKLDFSQKEKVLKENAKKTIKEVFGFSSVEEAKKHLKKESKKTDGYYIIKKQGLELFYADNCRPGFEYQINGNYKGILVSVIL